MTEVVQNGNDFTWTQHFPGGRTTTNTFTVDKQADMETMGGRKFQVNSWSSSAPQPGFRVKSKPVSAPVKVSLPLAGGET